MQLCPAKENAFAAQRVAASSTFASASTITGSRSRARGRPSSCGARERMPQPTAPEPVKVISFTRSSSTSTSPIADDGADDDVEPARGQARLVLELGQQQRRERRLRGGLEHDRAAGGERGRDLVGDEVEREVERRDRADDTDRAAQRERELALAGLRRVHRHHLAGQRARLDGGHRVGRHRARHLDASGLQRLAGLGRDLARGLVGAASERAGDAHEDLGPLVRRERRLHCACRCVERPPRLGRARLRHAGDGRRRRTVSAISTQSPVSTHSPSISSLRSVTVVAIAAKSIVGGMTGDASRSGAGRHAGRSRAEPAPSGARATPRARARLVGACARRLARDTPRSGARGDARRGDLTVDDPRFSTAQVVGPSMLSLDGTEHGGIGHRSRGRSGSTPCESASRGSSRRRSTG